MGNECNINTLAEEGVCIIIIIAQNGVSSMTEQNIEYQSLVQCANDLTRLIQHNVVSVSTKLFAKGLVPRDVHDSVLSVDGISSQSKAAKLLSCVCDKIKDSAYRFQEFIGVLNEDSYFEDIVIKIKEVHGMYLDHFNILFLRPNRAYIWRLFVSFEVKGQVLIAL